MKCTGLKINFNVLDSKRWIHLLQWKEMREVIVQYVNKGFLLTLSWQRWFWLRVDAHALLYFITFASGSSIKNKKKWDKEWGDLFHVHTAFFRDYKMDKTRLIVWFVNTNFFTHFYLWSMFTTILGCIWTTKCHSICPRKLVEVIRHNVGTLKDGYLHKVHLPRVPCCQSIIPVACAVTFPVNPYDTNHLQDTWIPLPNNLTRLLLDVSKLCLPFCLAGWYRLAINSIEQPFVSC